MSPGYVILGDMEERSIPGLSRYRFREDGAVISLWHGRAALSGGTDKDGYRKFVLIDDLGRRRYLRRASLICTAFLGPRPLRQEVRHLDGSRTNDAIDNLTWGTQAENIADKQRHGTTPRGATHGQTKLTKEDVQAIRNSTDSHAVTARKYGVSKPTISGVRARRTWRWLQ